MQIKYDINVIFRIADTQTINKNWIVSAPRRPFMQQLFFCLTAQFPESVMPYSMGELSSEWKMENGK